jgi:hypothetical protein
MIRNRGGLGAWSWQSYANRGGGGTDPHSPLHAFGIEAAQTDAQPNFYAKSDIRTVDE